MSVSEADRTRRRPLPAAAPTAFTHPGTVTLCPRQSHDAALGGSSAAWLEVLQRHDGRQRKTRTRDWGTPWTSRDPGPALDVTRMSLLAIQRRKRSYVAIARARYWRLLHPGVRIGRTVRIGSGCRLFLDPGARLVLGARCHVDDATTIAVYEHGCIELGPGSFVGHHCTIAARAAVEIGAGTYLAELVSVRDHDHVVGAPPGSGEMTVDPVVIGANVWIGAKATVLRGARIGDGAVIGANAVVRGELPPYSVCAGVPARVIRLIDLRAPGCAQST